MNVYLCIHDITQHAAQDSLPLLFSTRAVLDKYLLGVCCGKHDL